MCMDVNVLSNHDRHVCHGYITFVWQCLIIHLQYRQQFTKANLSFASCFVYTTSHLRLSATDSANVNFCVSIPVLFHTHTFTGNLVGNEVNDWQNANFARSRCCKLINEWSSKNVKNTTIIQSLNTSATSHKCYVLPLFSKASPYSLYHMSSSDL